MVMCYGAHSSARPWRPAPTAWLAGKRFRDTDLQEYIEQVVARVLGSSGLTSGLLLSRVNSRGSRSSRGKRGAGSDLRRRRWWLLEKQRRCHQSQLHRDRSTGSSLASSPPGLQGLSSLALYPCSVGILSRLDDLRVWLLARHSCTSSFVMAMVM